jgi:hypothetical protein
MTVYGRALVKCTAICAFAETGAGAIACARCVGTASAVELACIHLCNDKFCHCESSTECKPVDLPVVGAVGLYLTKQCCTEDEDCTIIGCAGGCDKKHCKHRGFLGNCYNTCTKEQACCGGACKNISNDVKNCGACFNECPPLRDACCGSQCCFTNNRQPTCRSTDGHLLVWGGCGDIKSGHGCDGFIDTGQLCPAPAQ